MKLLIVDDDPVSRTALRQIIGSPYGWSLVEASDGQQALDLLCDGLAPDLAIIDLTMPRVTGMELLQRIRRDPDLKALKVVVSSSTRDRATILALAKLQISGYLLKPYEAGRTQAVLQPLLPQAANPLRASRNLLQRTLLVVEDDPVIQAALEDFGAAAPGWTVTLARSAADALDRLRAGDRPDLLLTDLSMDGMNGIQLIRRIRGDRHLESQRIAVMSATQDAEQVHELRQLMVVHFLLKPFDANKLLALLQRVEAES